MLSLFWILLTILLPHESLSEVTIEIIQPNHQRILNFAEILFVQDGQSLPEHLTTFTFSSFTQEHDDVRFCNDGNLLTYCKNSVIFNVTSGMWEGAEARPSLFIRLRDAYFDKMVKCSRMTSLNNFQFN